MTSSPGLLVLEPLYGPDGGLTRARRSHNGDVRAALGAAPLPGFSGVMPPAARFEQQVLIGIAGTLGKPGRRAVVGDSGGGQVNSSRRRSSRHRPVWEMSRWYSDSQTSGLLKMEGSSGGVRRRSDRRHLDRRPFSRNASVAASSSVGSRSMSPRHHGVVRRQRAQRGLTGVLTSNTPTTRYQ